MGPWPTDGGYLYYDAANALKTKAKLAEITSNLRRFTEAMSVELERMSRFWGKDQADFIKYKTTINKCIEKYSALCNLNDEVTQYITELGSYMTEISTNTIN